MSLGKQLRNRILCAVRVLVLVHEDVVKFLLVLFTHLCVIREELHRQHEQIVEIQCIVCAQLRLVELVDLCHLLRKEIRRLCRECLDIEQAVLRIRNMRLDGARCRMLLVDIQFLQTFADQRLGIRGIIDDKVLRIGAKLLDLHAQETGAEGVERAQPDIVRGIPDQRVHTVAHFSRCLVREGDGKNTVRRNSLLQEVCNAEGQYARLAGASARHDEERPLKAGNGLLLWLVQPLK